MPRYSPGQPPFDPAMLAQYLTDELNRVAASVGALYDGEHEVLYAAPAKPQLGMVVYADGTQWDPGDGPGAYSYEGTATANATWVKL